MSPIEMLYILLVVLLLFGFFRLPRIARRMGESMSEMSGEKRQRSGDSRPWWFFVLVLIAVSVILSVLSLDVFSDKQKLATTIVLLGWIGVAYWSFGRKGNDQ